MLNLCVFVACSLLLFAGGIRGDEVVSEDVSCGPTSPRCPPNFRCVPGAGCIAANATCRCATKPCEWPMRCDCREGCALRKCVSLASCGRERVNPRDRCEEMECRRSFCQSKRLTCPNCDPKTGCPSEQSGHQKRRDPGGVVDDVRARDGLVGARWDDGGGDWHHNNNNGANSFTIGYSVFLGLVGLIIVLLFIYVLWARGPRAKAKMST
jgi:hypothetical protein